jgi:hypothetical protein
VAYVIYLIGLGYVLVVGMYAKKYNLKQSIGIADG